MFLFINICIKSNKGVIMNFPIDSNLIPTVYLKDGNKQKIILQNKNNINYEISTTPDKIDEYIKSRNKTSKIGVYSGLITLGAAIVGGLVGHKIFKDSLMTCMFGLFSALTAFAGEFLFTQNKLNNLNEKFITDNLQK
jgi:hypothetical protein